MPTLRITMKQPEVSVSTTYRPSDDPKMVAKSLQSLFPEINIPTSECESFPITNNEIFWEFDGVDLTAYLSRIAELRILDTALDAMGTNLHQDETVFSISRQAALANKVAFVLNGERALGGTIEITLKGENLAEWLEEETWHEGRIEMPRTVSDEYAMRRDGEVTEWFDNRES